MCDMKSLPLSSLLRSIYPDLYPVHRLADFVQTVPNENEGEGDEITIPNPPRLRLSAEKCVFFYIKIIVIYHFDSKIIIFTE